MELVVPGLFYFHQKAVFALHFSFKEDPNIYTLLQCHMAQYWFYLFSIDFINVPRTSRVLFFISDVTTSIQLRVTAPIL